MTAGVVPITDDERKARIAKAQLLMRQHKIDAIYLEPGSSMFYFTGMRWSTSERMLALGSRGVASSPGFVPSSKKSGPAQLIRFGKDIRTWEEDESLIAGWRKFFAIEASAPDASAWRSGCASFFRRDSSGSSGLSLLVPLRSPRVRMFKSPAEIALMPESE